MKLPIELSQRLAKQWHQSRLRQERLLSSSAWPIELSIGKPSAKDIAGAIRLVQQHVQAWKNVVVGEVVWEKVNYRAGTDPISVPVRWSLKTPSEWIAAAADKTVTEEFTQLTKIIEQIDQMYWSLFIQQRTLWHKKDLAEVVRTANLAQQLSPGCANGLPLRLLSGLGIDTKFIARNSKLLTRLLDERFEGAASEQGLSNFLDALDEGDHWVLLTALSPGLLPFRRLRITTAELATAELPGSRLLIVENEQCIHLLPALPDTLVILGAGLDLSWLQSPALTNKNIGYWGDMDSWGLLMLARARSCCPDLVPLLMNKSLFDHYPDGRVVSEPVPAQPDPPKSLTNDEAEFYLYLLSQQCGRFEQEFLPAHEVENAMLVWAGTPSSDIR